MKKSWLNNTTIIITGASGGLGFAITKQLVENHNAKVIGICRNEEKMKKSLLNISKNKENFSYRVFDVRDKEKWQELYLELSSKNIIVDVLINNAGIMLPFEKFEDISIVECDEVIETNFKANLTSTRVLLPLLKQSKNATLCNIVSAAGYLAVIGQSLYSASKFAMKGFTDSFRAEYKGKIKVTGIYPGFIKTDIMQRQKVNTKDNKFINSLMADVNKTAKKIIKAIIKHKKSVCLGFDGKFMCFFGRLFPNFTLSFMAFILKKSKQELFNELFS